MTLFYYNNMSFELNKRVFYILSFFQFSSVQSLNRVWLFTTLWTAARQGLPAHHQLPEFTQTHVHWVGNAIQPSHPLSSPLSHLQSFSASGSFQMSQFFTSGDQSIGVSASASVLSMNIQDWVIIIQYAILLIICMLNI